MLLKVVFVKFKISNKFEQNIDETHSKQPKIHRKIQNPHQAMDFQNLKKKIHELKVCDFQKENHTLWYGFKKP
jgi:hypothetical protein